MENHAYADNSDAFSPVHINARQTGYIIGLAGGFLHSDESQQMQKDTQSQMLGTQPTFTPSQYQKILQIIDKEDSVDNAMINTAAGDHVIILSKENLENVLIIETLSPNHVNDKQREQIVDPGATCPMTSSINTLNEVSSCNKVIGRKIYLPNGQNTSISPIGSCILSEDNILNNVLVVPDFKFDLLSVSNIT